MRCINAKQYKNAANQRKIDRAEHEVTGCVDHEQAVELLKTDVLEREQSYDRNEKKNNPHANFNPFMFIFAMLGKCIDTAFCSNVIKMLFYIILRQFFIYKYIGKPLQVAIRCFRLF